MLDHPRVCRGMDPMYHIYIANPIRQFSYAHILQGKQLRECSFFNPLLTFPWYFDFSLYGSWYFYNNLIISLKHISAKVGHAKTNYYDVDKTHLLQFILIVYIVHNSLSHIATIYSGTTYQSDTY